MCTFLGEIGRYCGEPKLRRLSGNEEEAHCITIWVEQWMRQSAEQKGGKKTADSRGGQGLDQ